MNLCDGNCNNPDCYAKKKPKSQFINIKLTKRRMRELGLIWCQCGHAKTQHFDHGKKPCAHCQCKQLDETLLASGVYFV